MKEVIYANEFDFTGIVFDVWENEKNTVVRLMVEKRVNKNKEEILTVPKIVFWGEAAKEAAKYKKGDKVSIKAYMHTKRNEENNTVFYTQWLTGLEITKASGKLEEIFGFTSDKAVDLKNEFKIAGSCTYIDTPKPDYVRINVRTVRDADGKSRSNVVRCKYFTKDVGAVMSQIRKGDNLCMVGYLSTGSYVDDTGKKSYIENVIASDLKKL